MTDIWMVVHVCRHLLHVRECSGNTLGGEKVQKMQVGVGPIPESNQGRYQIARISHERPKTLPEGNILTTLPIGRLDEDWPQNQQHKPPIASSHSLSTCASASYSNLAADLRRQACQTGTFAQIHIGGLRVCSFIYGRGRTPEQRSCSRYLPRCIPRYLGT